MSTMKIEILLVVLAVVAMSESFSLSPDKRRFGGDRSCRSLERAAVSCQPLADMSSLVGISGFPITFDVDQMCQAFDPYRNCLNDKAAACSTVDQGVTTQLNLGVNMHDFTCSTEGKAMVNGMMASPCNSADGTARQAAMAELKGCGRVAALEARFGRDRCGMMRAFMNCVSDSLRSSCGEHVADYADTFVNLLYSTPGAFHSIFQMDCSADDVLEESAEDFDFTLLSKAVEMFM